MIAVRRARRPERLLLFQRPNDRGVIEPPRRFIESGQTRLVREQLRERDLAFPALRELRPKFRDPPLQVRCRVPARRATNRRCREPLVADQKRTIVSSVQGVSRRASRKPPCSSSTGSPFCQIDTAAPSSPKREKFSSKSGLIRAAKSSARRRHQTFAPNERLSSRGRRDISIRCPARAETRCSRDESTERRCAKSESKCLCKPGSARAALRKSRRPKRAKARPVPANDAVTGRRGVAFFAVDLRDRHRNFRPAKNHVGKTAPEFARRAVIGRRRILDIGQRGGGKSGDEKATSEAFHEAARVN